MVSTLQLGAEWITQRAGGLNRYAAGLAGGLEAIGAEQRWLVMACRDALATVPEYVYGVAAPTDSLWKRHRTTRRAVATELIALEPDLIASHFALYAWPVRRELKRRAHVVHYHGPWADESSAEGAGRLTTAAKWHIEQSVYQTGRAFITLSRSFARVLAERYRVDEGKIRVVPGGVDAGRFRTRLGRCEAREQLGWPSDRPTVLCVRRLARRMGLENLIDATRELARRHPDVLVMIGGAGRLAAELERRIAAVGLKQQVQLLGFVAEQDLPLAYRAADLSVVPTQALEGFGLVVLESLAAGTPALVTPVGGLPEVVERFAPDLVLESATTAAIADGLSAALDGSLPLPTSYACQRYVQQSFDWPQIARRVMDVYLEVSGR